MPAGKKPTKNTHRNPDSSARRAVGVRANQTCRSRRGDLVGHHDGATWWATLLDTDALILDTDALILP
jgi:hypothetical protein